MSRLSGKVAVITGASTGIGRATFELFAREGARVVGAARTKWTLQGGPRRRRVAGGTGMVVAGDLSEDSNCEALIDAAVSSYGQLDIVVNNAGVGWAFGVENPGTMAKLGEISTDHWRQVLAINLDSYFFVTRAALGHMTARGQRVHRQRGQHGRRHRPV